MCTPGDALFTFLRSAFMTFLAVIASTGLGMEEFISPTVLVDIAICGESEQTNTIGE